MGKHAVQFYEDDIFLIKGLADYIGTALAQDDVAVAIATAEHLRQLESTLARRNLLDAGGRALRGHYVALEAESLLPLFMANGLPDETRFCDTMGRLIADAAEQRSRHLYIYGEMVALLCAGSHNPLRAVGQHEAAIHIERYFNNLQRHYGFTLLCGYPLHAFCAAEDAGVFSEVCGLHSEVRPAESYDPAASGEQLRRTIATLQQQAMALGCEVRDRREIERALHEVNFDGLTGLRNRSVFQDRLDLEIKKAQRSGLALALLFIDLDHFKEINDTRGHDTGDELLKQVGHRLQGYVRDTDTVARLGGDEFTITLPELHELGTVTDIAQKIRDDLARPFLLGSERVYITASIGITLYPRDAGSAGELLRNADQAMYRSKERGRNRFTYFKSSMQEAAQSRMAMSNELRRAFEEAQLRVCYQPIVDLDTGRICKAEALLRWDHPQRGQISPVDFIPIAEHNGMIAKIGDWVFHQALEQARRWRRHSPRLTVNVNVSPVQFYQGNGDGCGAWIADSAPPGPQRAREAEIGLEITEGLLLAANPAVLRQFLAFQRAGIPISLDDFGTGYSSLSYLRKFDLDYLKIDKSFVYNLEHDAANVALCEAIIVMAHKLGLRVIAEGVETQAQARMLRHAECDMGQGFLYGPALAPAEFERLLRNDVAA